MAAIETRERQSGGAVAPDWFDRSAEVVRAWVPGADLRCRVCSTRALVWGEFRRPAPGLPRMAQTGYCLRHLPEDWYTGYEPGAEEPAAG